MKFGTFLVAGVVMGSITSWIFIHNQSVQSSTLPASNQAIRISGYSFTKPILIGDHGSGADSPELKSTNDSVRHIIDTAIGQGKISSGSVYFRNLNVSQKFSINGDETYYPASLTKVPLMISYFKKEELSPGALQSKVQLTQQQFNSNLEIPPQASPVPGQEYSNDQLIDYMIKYSDNNSFNQLLNQVKDDQLRKLYDDMQVYYPFDQKILSDVITPGQFSLFLRILYNSTYLSPDSSEKALKLMSESEYSQGLVAGVPSNLKVAHKFGIQSNFSADGNQLNQRQLHDCGIIYHPKTPYALCVMTKGNSDLSRAEQVIAEISKEVYQDVDARSKAALNPSLAQYLR